MYLATRNAAALTAFATEVSTPGSKLYGHYLTAAQAQAEFLATPAQVKSVEDWLTGAGLTVTSSTAHAVNISGTPAAYKRAFGASLDRFAVKGKTMTAPASTLVVPASVSSLVLGVSGLTSAASTIKPTYVPVSSLAKATKATKATKGGISTTAVCSDYWDQKEVKGAPAGYTKKTYYDECSFDPAQLRQTYGVAQSGLTGKGVKVAIVDAYGSSTMLADADEYATNHGDKAFRTGQYTEDVTPSQWNSLDACGGAAGWAPEEALDVEMVHGMAPDADVTYVGANSCNDNDLQAALANIVDNHLADIVSNSWAGIMYSSAAGDGETAASIAEYEQIFQQGAAEGIGFDFSAGDCGDDSPAAAATGANCDPTTTEAQTQFPSADPWVTDVGGTASAIKDKKGDYGFETDMGTLLSLPNATATAWDPLPGFFYFGGGGGTSQAFAQPWYQVGVVPNSLSHTLMTGAHSDTAQRVTPDVATNGDLFTSVLVGFSDGSPYSEGGYGGTSVSAPTFTGIQADAIQARGDVPLGFANPEIYSRYGTKDFNDVVNKTAVEGKPPLNAVFDNGLNPDGTLNAALVAFGRDYGLSATKGYDDATGVGSPTEAYLESFLQHGHGH